MFIYNLKINGSKLFKTLFIIAVIVVICIACVIVYRIFSGASNSISCTPQSDICNIETKNYTNVLKSVHDNIDNYIGMKIHFTGYIYRISDLADSQFVLARDMIISSDYQSVVVGFLCDYKNAKDFENDCWVEITGEITKGDYHGDMPIVKIIDIKKVDKPNEELVYPPDESYIPTSGIV